MKSDNRVDEEYKRQNITRGCSVSQSHDRNL